ncbi:hypothetical protein EOPP23_14370 [Endozoicomonas sp. OPT23]|nr:hypothetical protein [Endozoicomonas sp. OPT23]
MNTIVRASGLNGYLSLMESLSVDAEPILAHYGIDIKQLSDTESLLSLASVINVLEESAKLTKLEDFGLRLSNHQNLEVLGSIALVVQSADTLGSAIELAIKYLHIHSPGLILSLRESTLSRNSVAVGFTVDTRLPSRHRQCLELCISNLYQFIRDSINLPFSPLALTLSHHSDLPINRYKKYFNCKIIFDFDSTALHIPEDLLAAPLNSSSSLLQNLGEEYLESRFGSKEATLSSIVKRLLFKLLGSQNANRDYVCRVLSIHPKTLQRRLSEENESFEKLRDEVRQHLMERYIKETRISFSQLSLILGYSEQSVMTRACKRWFKCSPSVLRNTYRNQQESPSNE